jgi:hypothetical protein
MMRQRVFMRGRRVKKVGVGVSGSGYGGVSARSVSEEEEEVGEVMPKF